MNNYQKKMLLKHQQLFDNGCYETLDIICPGAKRELVIALDACKSWTPHRYYFTDYIHANYNCGWYPRIELPSIWERIKNWLKKLI